MEDSHQEFLNSHENMSWLKPEVDKEKALKYLEEQSPKELPAHKFYDRWVKIIQENVPAEGARYPTHVQLTGTYPEEPQNPKYRTFSRSDYNIFLTSTTWVKQLKEDYKLKGKVYFDGYEFKDCEAEYPVIMIVRYDSLGFIPKNIISFVFDNRVMKDMNDTCIFRSFEHDWNTAKFIETTEQEKKGMNTIYELLSAFFGFNFTVDFPEA